MRDPRKVLVRAAEMAASPRVAPGQGLPLPVVPGLLLPADCRALGAYLAQDTRWPAVGNRVMSTPISAMSSCAPVRPTPVISSSWVTWRAKGTITSSIRPVSASIQSVS